MKVSIIIPIFNGVKTIERVISSALNQEYDDEFEIIAVDDFSSDGTADICKKYPVKLIQNRENLGLAKTYNMGISHSKYEVIVTLHQDCVPASRDWLKKLVEPLKEKDVVASSGVYQLPEEVWEKYNFWEKAVSVGHLRLLHGGKGKSDAYKKEVIEKIGLFDGNTYRTAGEDIAMFLELWKRGRIVDSDSKVYHFHHLGQQSIPLILKKELQLGESEGVLRGVFKEKRGKDMFTLGGGVPRTMIFLGCLNFLWSPIIGSAFVAILLVFSSYHLLKLFKKTKDMRIVLVPILNVLRFFVYTIGFWKGFLTRKQRV